MKTSTPSTKTDSMLSGQTNFDHRESPPLEEVQKAFLIREVEERFLALFAEGRLSGTVHTCVGQEFSALAFAGQLQSGDFVFSNHRCHGHFLAFTGDLTGLVAELMGRETGVCGGLGGSQHLCKNGFFSNGIQGGIAPVAVGMAWAKKAAGEGGIGVVYLGDGTLGEGVVYESFNLAAIHSVPLLFVCEDNGMAQSTRTSKTLAGDITSRAEAFGLKVWEGTTNAPSELLALGETALNWVRSHQVPGFVHVSTSRLNPHSKGDDDRDSEELAALGRSDFLCQLEQSNSPEAAESRAEAKKQVDEAVAHAEKSSHLSLSSCLAPASASSESGPLAKERSGDGERVVSRLNAFLHETMEQDERVVMVGEDIVDPYGGAFKVTRGLSSQFPDRVLGMPISEAGLTGMANGMALAGWRPWAEIMFGDFVTLALDQIINHASKFCHMYNRQVDCPLVVRMAVGGGRGYGPTHSQSLEKLLCGIDNCRVVALNSWLDPAAMLRPLRSIDHPALVVEHKLDYGRLVGVPEIPNYSPDFSIGAHPSITLLPSSSQSSLTIVTYGGMAAHVSQLLPQFIKETEILPEIVVIGQISPLDLFPILESIERTGHLVVIEEGGTPFGIGGEILSSVVESGVCLKWGRRIGAAPIPIPSPPVLEEKCLPSRSSILESLLRIVRTCPLTS